MRVWALVSAYAIRSVTFGVAALACREERGQLSESGQQVDESKAAHRPANEIVDENGSQCGHGICEVVTLPEGRPRQGREQQADFQKERDEKQASNQLATLARCSPLRDTLVRSMCTSRK